MPPQMATAFDTLEGVDEGYGLASLDDALTRQEGDPEQEPYVDQHAPEQGVRNGVQSRQPEQLIGSEGGNAEGPLREDWRDGDSVFSLATHREIELACRAIVKLRDAGSLTETALGFDARRPNIGQVTFVSFRKGLQSNANPC